LIEWQQMNLDWYAAGVRGEKPAIPAPGYSLRELPRLNQMIYRKHHRRSLEAVLLDYETFHERVIKLIISLPDSDLVTLERFSWTGPSWTLSDYLRASTAAHYLWARKHVKRWWRATANANDLTGSPAMHSCQAAAGHQTQSRQALTEGA